MKAQHILALALTAATTLASPSLLRADDSAGVAPEALALKNLIQNNCISCHSGDGQKVSQFGDFLKSKNLLKYVNRSDPKKSLIYRKVDSGDMPDGEFGDYLDDNGRKKFLDALVKWQEAGAPPFEKEVVYARVTNEDTLKLISNDLKHLQNPRGVRYFSFVHLFNNSATRETLDRNAQGLSKLLNSLSWNKKITAPVAVGTSGLFRINIADYGWDESTWGHVEDLYPYRKEFISAPASFDEIARIIGSQLPIVRGDWFLFQASQPPLYETMLNLPSSVSGLESLFSINIVDDVLSGRVERAGFLDSGVSQNNRVIERHKTTYGAFWESYDFKNSVDEKNIFAHPLGPVLSSAERQAGIEPFVHDGGEMIFNLPNGLQAYFLTNGKGQHLDQGPIEIVSDPHRPDRRVTNGVSCMSCHSEGIILKSDNIRDSILSNPLQNKVLSNGVANLYGRPVLATLMEQDRTRFLNAQALAGVKSVNTEVISNSVYEYEATLDPDAIAYELDLTKEQIAQLTTLAKSQGTEASSVVQEFLNQINGGMKRQTFEFVFDGIKKFMANQSQPVVAPLASAGTAPQNILSSNAKSADLFDFTVGDRVYGISKSGFARIRRQTGAKYEIEYLDGDSKGSIETNLTADSIGSLSGCVKDGLCVGQQAFNSDHKDIRVKVVGVQKNGKYIIQFLEGKFTGQTGDNWTRNDLILPAGCNKSGSVCVGQKYIYTGNDSQQRDFDGAPVVEILGIAANDTFLVRYLDGVLKDKLSDGAARSLLARQSGCTSDGLCVGDTFYNLTIDNGDPVPLVQVAAIELRNTVVVEFKDLDLKGKRGGGWSKKDFAKTFGCDSNRSFCVGQKFTLPTRKNARVRVIAIDDNTQTAVIEFETGDLTGKRGTGWSSSDFQPL
jgi:hypothetical protein